MTKPTNASARPAVSSTRPPVGSTRPPMPHSDLGPSAGPRNSPPETTDDFLRCIEAMNLRINGYVQYMAQVGALTGTSSEVRDKAVAAFYERMNVLERQLARIRDDLQLE